MSITLNESILSNYLADVFIETGTYIGGAVEIALKLGFKEIYTIEIVEEFFNIAKNKFLDNSNVHCFLGSSSELLEQILNKITEEKTITFWLDGHFIQTHEPDFAKDKFPLMDELNIIKNLKNKKHNILIDDVRCFNNVLPHTQDQIEAAIKNINKDYKINYIDSSRFSNDILAATV